MKILILGASGMLGSALIRILNEKNDWDVFGTIRSNEVKKLFSPELANNLIECSNVIDFNILEKTISDVAPDVVMNCISLNKHLLSENNPLLMIPIYSLLPHQLSKICGDLGVRLIHISTDGVFSGAKGGYVETDISDAQDLYGKTKFLGEVHDSHTISIRTSIIGHELKGSSGLLGWFLSQKESCKCFSKAIFSGFPTVVLAQIIRDVVIPRPDLYGVYHIAAEPISKCDLLRLIADVYDMQIEIIPDKKVAIDRSLNAERFHDATGYEPLDWLQLIKLMCLYK